MVKNVCLMHILHFEMSISASKCAIIISNIHLLMYYWNKLQHMQHKNWLFFFNVVKYNASHLRQLIESGLLKFSGTAPPRGTQFFRFHIHFHRKAPTLEVHAPPPNWVHAPTGNPGSASARELWDVCLG